MAKQKIDQTETVYACLPTAAEGWATARAVAEATGLGYSTVTGKLRDLVTAGRAQATEGKHIGAGPGKVYRRTGTDVPADAEPAENVQDVSDGPGVDDPTPVSPAPAGDDVAAVTEWMQEVRPVSAPPADATPAESTGKRSHNGPVARGEMRQWARGELKGAITTHLQGNPDAVVSPVALARELGAQAGSVAFACQVLAKEGVLVLAEEKPAKYRAA